MASVKLTRALIDSTQPDPDRDVWIWDVTLPGFGVRVKPSGVKSYLIQYRTRQGLGRKMTLGSVDLIPLQQARERARKLLVGVRDGEDPQGGLKAEREAITLNQAFDRLDAEHIRPHLKPSTGESYRALFDRYVRESLGKKPLMAITRSDLIKFHSALADSPYSANRILAVLVKIFSVAEADWEILPDGNPARRLKKFPEQKRDRILDRPALAALWTALDEFSELYPHRAPLADLFRLTLLTGTRKGEWLSAKWSDVDLERALLILKDSKTGAKIVEISSPAVAILQRIRSRFPEGLSYFGELYVLSLDGGTSPIKYPYTAWREILELAGLPRDLRIHDLRHVFGSYAHRLGASQRTIAELLGHKTLAMTDRYIQGFSDSRRLAADTTARAIIEVTSIDSGDSSSPQSDEARTDAKAEGLPSARPRQRTTPAR